MYKFWEVGLPWTVIFVTWSGGKVTLETLDMQAQVQFLQRSVMLDTVEMCPQVQGQDVVTLNIVAM